jgi:hypothetical protein
MNQDQLTRKDQILRYLQAHKNEWVDGTDLATAEVGGSEGLRRLRELRAEQPTIAIQQRRHPNPDRDIWQYRLIDNRTNVSPIRAGPKLVFGVNRFCSHCGGKGEKSGERCGMCEGRGWI